MDNGQTETAQWPNNSRRISMPLDKTAYRIARERKADKFNRLVLEGTTQTEAWYQVNRGKRSVPYEQATSQAAKYANDPYVKGRLQAYLKDAKIQDMDSAGRAHADILRLMDLSVGEKNLTAAASFARIRSQHLQILHESVQFTQSAMPDDEIVKRLAGDDPVLQANVRRMLGRAGFDQSTDAASNVTPMQKPMKSTS